jgi:hypothetical protein
MHALSFGGKTEGTKPKNRAYACGGAVKSGVSFGESALEHLSKRISVSMGAPWVGAQGANRGL